MSTWRRSWPPKPRASWSWAVEGARRFLSEGLEPPASVRASTADYRANEDTVRQFLEETGVTFDRSGEAFGLSELHETVV